MKKTLLTLGIVASLCSCNGSDKFHIEGNIDNAKDSTLYFEHIGIEDVTTLDSIKLSADGKFEFAGKCGEGPEFYRLRIGGQIINVSIDSTETVTIKSQMPNMASNYEVEGSEECKTIKTLALKQIELQEKVMEIQKDGKLNIGQKNDSTESIIKTYKEYVKENYLFKNPQSAASYFALFQAIGSYLIFNPVNNRDDVKCFGAVATSWDNFHPGSSRTKNLHNITIRGMQNTHKPVTKSLNIDQSKIKETGCIDIALKDIKGRVRHLQDLSGKVVMLDFMAYADSKSPARIMELRSLYNKYHAQGLEIFQVSIDGDEHFWQTSVDALPWICVRDAEGAYSTNLSLYGVQQLPTYFILDRSNSLKSRGTDMKNLESEIKKYL